MSLEDAIQPIVAAEDKVQLTFFNGSADAWCDCQEISFEHFSPENTYCS